MKVHIWTYGDPSVGTAGEGALVEIQGWTFDEVTETGWQREVIRESLRDAFAKIYCERPQVMFEEELEALEYE